MEFRFGELGSQTNFLMYHEFVSIVLAINCNGLKHHLP
jgi:hypothetical protein